MPDTPATSLDGAASPLDAAQVLEDAADLLLIHGRGQGRSVNTKTGALCLLGAISLARGEQPRGLCPNTYDDPGRVALERHLATHGTGPKGWVLDGRASAWLWNDDTDDDGEVRDTLLLVAKDLRNEARLL